MSDRYQALRDVARKAGLDALVLVPGANFTRLFNASFHQNERPLVVVVPVEGAPSAIVPNLELGSFEAIGFEGRVVDWRDQSGYQSAFDTVFATYADKRLGVEGQVMRVFIDQAIRQVATDVEIVDAQGPIAALRLCKNATEIKALRDAIRVSEQALSETLEAVRVGMTEKAIENLLVQRLFAGGADELSFSPIVAAGDNSARPHASARADYAVKAGDPLLVDFGARVNGLCADITRTFFIDHATDLHRSVYNTVLAANEAGHAASRPGATAHAVDDAATVVLEQSAHASRVRHKTGHGLGRDIHEDPYIMRGNRQTLQPGMVFTIEPGLYELGEFGVRIEDDVLVTESGSESLTGFDKSLTILPG